MSGLVPALTVLRRQKLDCLRSQGIVGYFTAARKLDCLTVASIKVLRVFEKLVIFFTRSMVYRFGPRPRPREALCKNSPRCECRLFLFGCFRLEPNSNL